MNYSINEHNSHRNTRLARTMAIPILFALAGCPVESDDASGFKCPKETDNATFSSFGRFELEASGRDITARNIVDNCDWTADPRHNGGVGNTLQIESQSGGVTMVWAYNRFHGFVLTGTGPGGWRGQITGGVRLGDHISDLYAAHPSFQVSGDGLQHTLSSSITGTIPIRVTSDVNGFMTRIYVGRYYRN